MRIRPIVLAVFLSATTSAAQPPQPEPAAREPLTGSTATGGPCRFADLRRHATGDRAQAQRLGDLPPGDLELAVVRSFDGCMMPVIVRQGFGAVKK